MVVSEDLVWVSWGEYIVLKFHIVIIPKSIFTSCFCMQRWWSQVQLSCCFHVKMIMILPHKTCSSCFSWYSRLCYPPHTYFLKLYCYVFRCCGLPKFRIIFDILGVHPNNFFLLHVQPLKVWMFTYNRIEEASPCMWGLAMTTSTMVQTPSLDNVKSLMRWVNHSARMFAISFTPHGSQLCVQWMQSHHTPHHVSQCTLCHEPNLMD